MVLLKNFINIFSISELRKKFLFTLGVLVVYRLGCHIPVIGIDINALHALMERTRGIGGLLSYLDMFSGGALRQATLFALGIMPSITASIMMQMLSLTVPYLEQMQKEGEYGRKIINQYTRYLSFFVSIFQATGYIFILESNNLVLEPGSWTFRIMFVFSLTVASMFVMWLGEQISLFGLGNGSSMIIFAGIVAQFPEDIFKTIYYVQQGFMESWVAVLILIGFIALAAFVVFVERGERKIPVQYSRRVVGQRVYGAQSTYIPFKVNTASVMPVILAGAVINVPLFLSRMLAGYVWGFQWLWDNLQPMSAFGSAVQFVLIIVFSYVYTALIFNPDELADNMKKSGGFIPGIRPGKQTASFFNFILTRLGFVGAIYLATLALLPNVIYWLINMPFYLSGTALLIVVGVGLDTAAQIESYLIEHKYEGFLSSGRLKGRMIR